MMSVPSLGLIAVITARKITSPSGMPTTIAIAPSAAPPALTTPRTPRGREADGLEDREVPGSLLRDQEQRGEQVDEADGDEQEARAEQDRADVGAFAADLVLWELGGGARGGFEAPGRGAGVRAGHEVRDHGASASTGSGSVAAGKISTRPSSSGSTWRPTSVSVTGSPATRTVTRSPTAAPSAS